MSQNEGPACEGFANYFETGYNDEEIILRFGLQYEGQSQPSFHYAVITTPGYAQKLRDLLDTTLRQHAELIRRKQFGSSQVDSSFNKLQ